MAATIPVEMETGTYSGRIHPHNGYYAADFGTARSGRRGSTSGTLLAGTHQAAAQG